MNGRDGGIGEKYVDYFQKQIILDSSKLYIFLFLANKMFKGNLICLVSGL